MYFAERGTPDSGRIRLPRVGWVCREVCPFRVAATLAVGHPVNLSYMCEHTCEGSQPE
jgi:hypothetical protein